MGKSKIEWCDYTFNPWIGCTKVSDGCKNCYAETWSERYPKWRDTWGPRGTRLRTSASYWKQPLIWNRRAEQESCRYRVFCGSLCDVFEDVGKNQDLDSWRVDLFALIDQTPALDWLLLTKRPEMAFWWRSHKNIWLGTSVENQEQADIRVPALLRKYGAKVRFLSVEPMLGPVDLEIRTGQGVGDLAIDYKQIQWVICGGESGANRRSFDLDWARDLRDQCQAAGVSFFFKQVDKVKEIPEDLQIREFPMERENENRKRVQNKSGSY